MSDRAWWQDGVIYQIYPRSFMDSDGDGVGDLEGIRQRLDYLAWLGVDAVWLSPCFPSPMADFGYDVADYCDIDPLFGTLADFDALVADAHARNLRVILDWVPNHTSNEHTWFVESRSDRASAKRDWYVWRDAAADGGPPNNWQSTFGGPAWTWDEATGQYYLHSFLAEQPDLDWSNPEVRSAMHDVLRFWLDRGVDGFRIDVVHKIGKDPELRDNPVLRGPDGENLGQEHLHEEGHPSAHEYLREVRDVFDSYPERMTVGEVFLLEPERIARYYGRGDELHLAFNFPFLFAPWSARAFGEKVEAFEDALPPEAWPDVVLSNHDVSRHASRYDDAALGDQRERLAALMLLTLRGTPFLYYGEEIGMRDVPVAAEQMLDPVGLNLHPSLGRDPERSPMQWAPGLNAGFTQGKPWLPVAADADTRNVAIEREDPASTLTLYRELLALRRSTPALHRGAYRRLPSHTDILAYERSVEGSRALVALNMGEEARRPALPSARVARGLRTRHGVEMPTDAAHLELAACEGAVLVLD